MKIETRRDGETLTIFFAGRLDALGKAAFSNEAKNFDFNRVKNLVFDFKDLAYISSAGIQAILLHYKYMMNNKGRVKIVNAIPEVFNVLSMSGFTKLPNLSISGKPAS